MLRHHENAAAVLLPAAAFFVQGMRFAEFLSLSAESETPHRRVHEPDQREGYHRLLAGGE